MGIPLKWHWLQPPRFGTNRKGPAPRSFKTVKDCDSGITKGQVKTRNTQIAECKKDPSLPLPPGVPPERAGRPVYNKRLKNLDGSRILRVARHYRDVSSDSSHTDSMPESV